MLPNVDLHAIELECAARTPQRILQQIAEHRSIAIEALQKISDEGTVVRTLKGDVIAHPALKVHADALKSEAGLLSVWARKPTNAFNPVE